MPKWLETGDLAGRAFRAGFFFATGTWPQWPSGAGFAGFQGVRKAWNRDRFRWSSWWYQRPRSSCGTKPDVLQARLWCPSQLRRPDNRLIRGESQRISLVAISTGRFWGPICFISFLEKFIQPLT